LKAPITVARGHRLRRPYNHAMANEHPYVLDNQAPEAGNRFDALSRLFDATTFGHLDRLGVTSGWKVWEVGAGSPGVARRLSQLVGDTGRVLATDIDTSWLDADETRRYDVVRHNVVSDAAPSDDFDLIHARLVLVHLGERAMVIGSLVDALRSGGWLLLEEADPMLQSKVCPDEWGDEQRLANKLKDGFRSILREGGVDLEFGRTLPQHLRSAGLVDVEADAYFPMSGVWCDELERATIEQIRDRLVRAGLATNEEIERHLRNVVGHQLDLATSPLISAWGRKP